MPPIHFDWNDLARAGDKIPHSEDDKPCGDGWISKEKECHDGDAHRPAPGENPYWTDENSAEERRNRDVPWNTNKPKSREERDKETEWEPTEKEELPPEEDEAPEPDEAERERLQQDELDRRKMEEEKEAIPDPEMQGAEERYREMQREDTAEKWAQNEAQIQHNRETLQPRELTPGSLKKTRNKLRQSIDRMTGMCMVALIGNRGYPGSTKEYPGERAGEWADASDRLKSWREFKPKSQEDVDLLADKVREELVKLDVAIGEELRAGHIQTQGVSNGLVQDFPSYAPALGKIESLLDRYESEKYVVENPQDIQAWDRFRRDPVTMKSVTEIPGFQLKGLSDPSNLTPKQEQDLHEAEALFASWRDNPGGSLHGAGLAKLFMGEGSGPGTELEPNYEAARIIADRSAKHGSEMANDFMWNEFGESEEWTPTSFVHDYRKAAQKAIKAAKTELGFDIPDFISDHKAMAKLERALNKSRKKYQDDARVVGQKINSLRHQRDSGLIDMDTYQDAYQGLIAEENATSAPFDAARQARNFALRDLKEKTEKTRQDLRLNLAMANQQSLAPQEYRDAISVGLDNRRGWRSRDKDKPAVNKAGNVTRKAQIAFDELMHARDQERTRNPMGEFTNADTIKPAIEGVLGYLHRDLIEGTGMLQSISWEAEAMFRAHADDLNNAIRLDVNGSAQVAVHEFGHHIEFRNPRVKNRFLDLYNERTEGIKPKKLARYEPHERFKIPKGKNAFFREYAGAVYESGGSQNVTELLSLGLEALESRKSFFELLKGDPEHLAIVLATIRGY